MPRACGAKVSQDDVCGANVEDLAPRFAITAGDGIIEVDWDSDSACDDVDTSSDSSFDFLDGQAGNVDHGEPASAKKGNRKPCEPKAKHAAKVDSVRKSFGGGTLPEGVWFTKVSKRRARLTTTEEPALIAAPGRRGRCVL
uniref:Uncharacterized protein n=1 Tax=Eutreptiella gymnastica TaxID=73025 RepID=A0A7S1JFV5_9EUGL